MRSVGKQARDESGKHPVNENDEENFARGVRSDVSSNARYRTEALRPSLRAKRSNPIARHSGCMDCFVAEPVIGRAFARPVGSSQ
jgi:hypothetical protein